MVSSREIGRQTDGTQVFVAQPFSENGRSPESHVVIPSILKLLEAVALLSEKERQLIEGFFEINREGGAGASPGLEIPEEMIPWVMENFGSEDRTAEETLALMRDQPIVHIQDRLIKNDVVVNELRRKRPQPLKRESAFQNDIHDDEKRGRCPFCPIEQQTPYDAETGRISRGTVVSAVNITKFAPDHLLMVAEHNPYETTREQFRDQVKLALDWARQKSAADPDKKFLRIGLNRGYRAAGSQVHDHGQGELRRGSMHFPVAERIIEIANNYRVHKEDPTVHYLDDYFRAHQALGLGTQIGKAKVLSMLVPPKEHGVMVIDDGYGHEPFDVSDDFIDALWEVQQFMMQKENVKEYNIYILPRPNNPDSPEYWSEYKPIAIFVDRGHSTSQNSDIGYAELSGTAILSYDVFDYGPKLNRYLLDQAA
ncbi:MAG: hypothetical protein HYV39_01270 [Candidatus Levybacteria bacterium]|nr:hypothetical protein [Candidatus Levybacteria bacterium]